MFHLKYGFVIEFKSKNLKCNVAKFFSNCRKFQLIISNLIKMKDPL